MERDREAFEAALKRERPGSSTERLADGDYAQWPIQMAWIGWQAALAYVREGVEPVAWQRRNSTSGWTDCRPEDVERYRALGQEIRPLYDYPVGLAIATQRLIDAADGMAWTTNSGAADEAIEEARGALSSVRNASWREKGPALISAARKASNVSPPEKE